MLKMGLLEMDQTSDFPESFDGFKCGNVVENVDMKHLLMEQPEHDNVAVDSYLGFGMENMGINSKMEEYSHGFDFSFLPDYGGLDSYGFQDREPGLKLEILDGFLDEVDDVEDIYASSSIGDHFLPETEVKKNVSELDGGGPCSLMNFSSESYSPGISGCLGLSEWSKEIVPHSESKNLSSKNDKDVLDMNSNDMHCFYESEDDRKPLSTFLGSWIKRGKSRKTNLLNTSCSSNRLDSFDGTMSRVSYDFRPRRRPLKKYIHTTTENTLFDEQLTSSESEEDDVSVVTNTSKTRNDRRKHQRMWTVEEVVKLMDGISHFGVGRWTDIKNLFFRSSSHRTPVDIRDKWRNLLKASYTHDRNDGEAEERRRSGRSIPKDILNRVRELASLHPYPFSKSLCLVHDSSRSRSTSKKKKKKRS